MRKFMIWGLAAGMAALGAQAQAAQPMDPGQQAFLQHVCSDTKSEAEHAKFVEWMDKRLNLNETQKANFKAFQDARAKSLADSKAKLCATPPDLSSFEARVVFGQTFMEARLEALKAENPKLIAFYNSLDEKQKMTFDEIRRGSRN